MMSGKPLRKRMLPSARSGPSKKRMMPAVSRASAEPSALEPGASKVGAQHRWFKFSCQKSSFDLDHALRPSTRRTQEHEEDAKRDERDADFCRQLGPSNAAAPVHLNNWTHFACRSTTLLCESCEWIEWSGEVWSMRKRDDADQAEWFINSRVNTPDTEIEVAWRATCPHA